MASANQSAIIWPPHFLPGTTDNFVSNETIIAGLPSQKVWDNLVDMNQWPKYYSNVSELTPPESGSRLTTVGAKFSFSTFGFPPLPATVEESTPPATGKPGRLAWRAIHDGDGDESKKVNVYHAWLIEDLEGGRVRILTQESQIGKPAAELAGKRPDVMLNGHQEWVDGLVAMSKGEKEPMGKGGFKITEWL